MFEREIRFSLFEERTGELRFWRPSSIPLGMWGTVARLPWIKTECCPGCPENHRKTGLALKKLGLEEAIKARPVDTSLIAVLIWRAKLNARGGDVSVSALAKESGLAENTVRAAVERAKAKGLWDE